MKGRAGEWVKPVHARGKIHILINGREPAFFGGEFRLRYLKSYKGDWF